MTDQKHNDDCPDCVLMRKLGYEGCLSLANNLGDAFMNNAANEMKQVSIRLDNLRIHRDVTEEEFHKLTALVNKNLIEGAAQVPALLFVQAAGTISHQSIMQAVDSIMLRAIRFSSPVNTLIQVLENALGIKRKSATEDQPSRPNAPGSDTLN